MPNPRDLMRIFVCAICGCRFFDSVDKNTSKCPTSGCKGWAD